MTMTLTLTLPHVVSLRPNTGPATAWRARGRAPPRRGWRAPAGAQRPEHRAPPSGGRALQGPGPPRLGAAAPGHGQKLGEGAGQPSLEHLDPQELCCAICHTVGSPSWAGCSFAECKSCNTSIASEPMYSSLYSSLRHLEKRSQKTGTSVEHPMLGPPVHKVHAQRACLGAGHSSTQLRGKLHNKRCKLAHAWLSEESRLPDARMDNKNQAVRMHLPSSRPTASLNQARAAAHGHAALVQPVVIGPRLPAEMQLSQVDCLTGSGRKPCIAQ